MHILHKSGKKKLGHDNAGDDDRKCQNHTPKQRMPVATELRDWYEAHLHF